MKIYTRTGDGGDTALFGGGRVPKTHLRVEAYGTVDELNAFLGRALGALEVPETRTRLAQVQHDLFALGAHLATPPPREGRKRPALPALPVDRIPEMERWMDECDEALPPLKGFILPGGSPGAAELHVCRTVCRRAERAVVAVLRAEGAAGEAADPSSGKRRADPGGTGGDPAAAAPASEAMGDGRSALREGVRYLNRLSDLLFVLARLENQGTGTGDVEWDK